MVEVVGADFTVVRLDHGADFTRDNIRTYFNVENRAFLYCLCAILTDSERDVHL